MSGESEEKEGVLKPRIKRRTGWAGTMHSGGREIMSRSQEGDNDRQSRAKGCENGARHKRRPQ